MKLIDRPESHVAENRPDHVPDKPYRLLFGCTYEESHQATVSTNMADILSQRFYYENISVGTLSKTVGSAALQLQILSIIDRFDIFLIMNGKPIFDFDFFKKLKCINEKLTIVYIDGDTHMNFLLYTKYLIDDIDLFVSFDSIYMTDYFGQIGLRSVCLGNVVNKQDFYPLKSVKKDIDVSFYGGIKGDRQQYLDRIREEKFNLQCFGTRFGGRLSQAELNSIICHSKIGLSFNKHGENPDKVTLPENMPLSTQIKSHIFEYMLCGSFVLSEHIEHFDRFFVPDKELASFTDEKDMVEKIRFYLDHPEVREEVSEAGHRKVMAHFEGSIQINKMANLIIKTVNEKRGLKESYFDQNQSYDVKPTSDLDNWRPNTSHFVNFRASLAHRFFRNNEYGLVIAECRAFRFGLPFRYIRTQLKYAVFGFLGRWRRRVLDFIEAKQ